ncbi:arsenate reductase (glutaredoxin) [Maritimibacter alkaliphilus]|nr:arsenate reductase (glutaredoxin) [Maritimibacter alkaliphilus]
MAVTVIWHNPRCTKSRETLALLEARGITPEVRRYLDDPPTLDELRAAREALGLPAEQMIRRKEALFKELNLAGADEEALLAAMAEHPKLIERPVVFQNGRAALGRPPEEVLRLFD